MYMIFSLQKLSKAAEKNGFVILAQISAVLTSHVTNDIVSIQIVSEASRPVGHPALVTGAFFSINRRAFFTRAWRFEFYHFWGFQLT